MGAIRRAISSTLDYSWPIAGGLAAVVHAATGLDRLCRLLRPDHTGPDYEHEPIA